MRRRQVFALFLAWSLPALAGAVPASAQGGYDRISGEGSSWAQVAIDVMRADVATFGMKVDYAGTGSTKGRLNFLSGQVDFAASDIPFQFRPEDGSAPEKPAAGSYAYIPVVAGGTAFMYNLKINGQRVTNLRLSGENVAKIFTGAIPKWNDPAIVADNPGLTLPDRDIVPIVRSDGSGSTAQFTRWMIHRHPAIWNEYCQRSGRAPACGATSFYPAMRPMIGQQGDDKVAGYVTASYAEGSIGYVNYSYALGKGYPVAKVLNAAGYYSEPTPENVAVSLLKAKINRDASSDDYLTQQLDDVYTDTDPRSYQLSAYSYFILRTKTSGQFSAGKGRTLGAFAYYAMCQAQQQSATLGYSPMPINLVEASFDQIRKVPGVEVQQVDIKSCNNPTFSADGTNVLAQSAAQPQECDKRGTSQCATGTGGARSVSTPVRPAAAGGGGGAAGAGSGSGGTSGSAGGPGAAGSTGTDTSAGSGAAATDVATAGDTAAAATGDACDPDTQACGPTGGTNAASVRSSGGGSGEQAVASPTVLPAAAGWSATRALILIVLLLTVALVFVPALVWRRLSSDQL